MAVAVAIGSAENGIHQGTSATGVYPLPAHVSCRFAHSAAPLFSRPFGRYPIGVLTRRKLHSLIHRRSAGPSLQRRSAANPGGSRR